jgi:hypothetical protein
MTAKRKATVRRLRRRRSKRDRSAGRSEVRASLVAMVLARGGVRRSVTVAGHRFRLLSSTETS